MPRLKGWIITMWLNMSSVGVGVSKPVSTLYDMSAESSADDMGLVQNIHPTQFMNNF